VPAFDHVTVACILLGSAAGTNENLAALHSDRLRAALTKMIDTTIHGVVYECRGTVEPDLLRRGAELVRSFSDRALAACAMLEADPSDHETWLRAGVAAVDVVLDGG
jgi:hypothetical protein